MDKESLIIAKEIVLLAIEQSQIKQIDKCELMRNLDVLLDNENYEKDIKTLILKEKEKNKWNK